MNKKYLKCFLIEVPILVIINLTLYLLNIEFNFVSYIEGVLIALLTIYLLECKDKNEK